MIDSMISAVSSNANTQLLQKWSFFESLQTKMDLFSGLQDIVFVM